MGNGVYIVTKYDKIQITDTTIINPPNSGGYLLQTWIIKTVPEKYKNSYDQQNQANLPQIQEQRSSPLLGLVLCSKTQVLIFTVKMFFVVSNKLIFFKLVKSLFVIIGFQQGVVTLWVVQNSIAVI